MARITVDMQKLLIAAYTDGLPGVNVIPELEASADDSLPAFPIVIPTPVTGAMVSNGNYRLGWDWTVSVVMSAIGRQQASDLADEIYQVAHGLEGTWVRELGFVSLTEDVSMPAPAGAADLASGKTIHQYNAQFRHIVRPRT